MVGRQAGRMVGWLAHRQAGWLVGRLVSRLVEKQAARLAGVPAGRISQRCKEKISAVIIREWPGVWGVHGRILVSQCPDSPRSPISVAGRLAITCGGSGVRTQSRGNAGLAFKAFGGRQPGRSQGRRARSALLSPSR